MAPIGSSRRRGVPLLAMAWAVVLLGLAGGGAWHALGRGAAPSRKPPEPFFIVLEPEPAAPAAPVAAAPAAPPAPSPAAPPSPGGDAAMPPLPSAQDVPPMAAKPPQEPAAPAPSATAAAPKPAAPTPPPKTAPAPSQAAAPPAGNPQTATAVAPPQPAPQTAAPAIWQKLATPFDANDTRPRVAVVIADLGLSSAATDAAIQNLPAGVTLSFSPYTDNLNNWINLARAAGHEVLLGLPMEPANFPTRDPGPRTLLTSLSPRENLDRLDWVLGRATGYVGVTNYMGSRFTTSPQALRPVLTTLRDRGLMFLDARTTPRSEAGRLATEISLPRTINDRFIDEQASRASIDAMLADVERVARETGNAVAMGQPYPVTFERLLAWLPTLESKGIALAPITALVNRQSDG